MMPPVSSPPQQWQRIVEAAIVTLILGVFASTSVGFGHTSTQPSPQPAQAQVAWKMPTE